MTSDRNTVEQDADARGQLAGDASSTRAGAPEGRRAPAGPSDSTENVAPNGPGAPGTASSAPAGTAPAGAVRASNRVAWFGVLLALGALALSAMTWFGLRAQVDDTRAEAARRVGALERELRDVQGVAREAAQTARALQGRLAQVEVRIADSSAQQQAIEALFQELSRTRDEWQLVEIEQMIAIAEQQLELSRNVKAALHALQLAEARLAQLDQPRHAALRAALAEDIERLRAVPTVDLGALGLRVDRLVAGVDSLALAYEERVPAKAAAAESGPIATATGFLARLGGEVWRELRQLVVIRRVDVAEPPLLAPSQAYFLRENLRLRLLNARLALLMRDEAGFREDLRAAQTWIRRYFDPGSRQTADMLAQIVQLSASTINVDAPGIPGTRGAVRALRAVRERGS